MATNLQITQMTPVTTVTGSEQVPFRYESGPGVNTDYRMSANQIAALVNGVSDGVLLASYDLAVLGGSSLDIVNVMTSDYDSFMIRVMGVKPGTVASANRQFNLLARVSDDNGLTFKSGHYLNWDFNTAATGVRSETSAVFLGTAYSGQQSYPVEDRVAKNAGIFGDLILYNNALDGGAVDTAPYPNAAPRRFNWRMNYRPKGEGTTNPPTDPIVGMMYAEYDPQDSLFGVVNAVRLVTHNGQAFFQGIVQVYGFRTSAQTQTPAGPEVLTADRTYYVRTDGNDGNDGLANDALGAWLTIQYAFDWCNAHLSFNGFTVTIQAGDAGSYDGAVWKGWQNGKIKFLGDAGAIGDIVVNPVAVPADNTAVVGICSAGSPLGIGFFTIELTGNNQNGVSATNLGELLFEGGMAFDANGHVGGEAIQAYVGYIDMADDFNYSVGDIDFSGTWSRLIAATGNDSWIQMYHNTSNIIGVTVSTSTIYAVLGGQVQVLTNWVGAVAGRRFRAQSKGVIFGDLNSPSIDEYPGNQPGVLLSGGTYNGGGYNQVERDMLLANRTYYVRTDGSDNNSGNANTAAGAFRTVQFATDVIQDQLDLGGFTVTVAVQAGAFGETVTLDHWIGGGDIHYSGAGTITQFLAIGAFGGTVQFDLGFDGNNDCIRAVDGAAVQVGAITVPGAAGVTIYTATREGRIYTTQAPIITATALFQVAEAASHSLIEIGSALTFNANTVISDTAFNAEGHSCILFTGAVNGSGVPVAKQFNAVELSYIKTVNSVGLVAGTTATGGVQSV